VNVLDSLIASLKDVCSRWLQREPRTKSRRPRLHDRRRRPQAEELKLDLVARSHFVETVW